MNKIFDRYFGSFIVILVVIGYFQLFRLSAFPYSVRALSSVAAVALLTVLIIIRVIYFKDTYIKMHFKGYIILLLLSSIPSYFIAYSYHKQDFIFSVYANRALLFYLLYFFLHLYKVPVKDIFRIIIVTGIFAVLLYYVQLALYPKFIMEVVSMESRGTLRLFVAGMICTIFAYFYFLNRYFESLSYKDLFFSLLCLSVFILQGTRQIIFATAFLTLVNLIISRRVQSKFLMLVLISMASFAMFLAFREIFVEIVNVSSRQSQHFESDIRIRAATFFLTDFMPSKIAYIFGNGNSDAGTPYDLKMGYYAIKYKFFQSDIGIIGDYVKYGIVFTLTGLLLLFRALTFKIPSRYLFMKFYIATQCFTLLTGKGLIGGTDIIIVMILYLFDTARDENTQTAPSTANKELKI